MKVQKADLTASNGVVHVIEKVLLPPKLTIVEALAGDGRFSTLVTAISLADLFETLDSGSNPRERLQSVFIVWDLLLLLGV